MVVNQLTLKFIAQSLGFTLNRADAEISTVVIDSRKVQTNSLFVALQGEKKDGHDFIDRAVQAGALAVLCRNDFSLEKEFPSVYFFKVPDTLLAYRKIAGDWRQYFPQTPIIGVTGSVGKTTTKELIASILRGKWTDVLKTQGSENGFVGIPLTLLELRKHHEAAVVEIGIDEPDSMVQHMAVVKPTHCILTAIGPEHLEKLKDLETVAHEELLSLELTLKNQGTIVVNLDDAFIRDGILKVLKKFENPSAFFFSFDAENTKPISGSFSDQQIFLGELQTDGQVLQTKNINVSLPLHGQHNARNLLGAVTLARSLGLNPEEIKQGLETFTGTQGRSQFEKFQFDGKTVSLLSDYYNANPSSMEASFEMGRTYAEKNKISRLILCLGDMLEMGTEELALHKNLARSILKISPAAVFLYGKRMKELEIELEKKDFEGHLEHFMNQEEVAASLREFVNENDLILLKGSRSMKMENILNLLKQKQA